MPLAGAGRAPSYGRMARNDGTAVRKDNSILCPEPQE
jgi:hypothetical protein